MLFTKLSALASLVALAAAAPAPASLEARALDTSSHCGQWDTATAGQYSLYVDQWGKTSSVTGQSCGQLTSLSGTTLAWKDTWSWSSAGGIKSYTNINLNAGLNKQLSAISAIPSTWKWSQAATGSVVSNVAYDLFTSDTSAGTNKYEIMIWLANFNAGPISYNYNAQGAPVPIATGLSFANKKWSLYYGSNGANYVYSFLCTSGTLTNFSADLNTFFAYLIHSQGLPKTQYLTTVQAGSEATSGSATLTTSAYSVVIQ